MNRTIEGHTPDEYLCKLRTQTPDTFTLDPIQQITELNN
ncbi:hypothetical protein HDF17_000198 [Granulicella arctica]|uniref:Uncharacterized protein n=1 Tax=Granulicella arctica TaxID=940613 RepID=A0A7Y9PDH2_9BACT|nr:hypothetical protein [Granulicella arctica]